MTSKVHELSDIERKVLLTLTSAPVEFSVIASSSGLPIDSVRRAASWLVEKGFADLIEKKEQKYVLTNFGETALAKGMPENIFLEALTRMGGKGSFDELLRESGLSRNEFSVALGVNKRKAFIVVGGNEISETGVAKEQETFSEQNALRDIADGKKISVEIVDNLQKRGLIEKKETTDRTLAITSDGEEAKNLLVTQNISRVYDVEAPVPPIFMGRKAPYVQFLTQIRKKLVALGFEEMYSPLIVSEFYNFDVLFQPQNHPARTWTDTYQLKQPKVGKLPAKKVVDAIRAAHEDGGLSGSSGWRYTWSEDVAKKLMPAAHGTAHSARKLVEGIKSPGKYFSVARVFRPDVLDATHLIEFNQMEGVIVGENLNFTHLLGMLKDFAIEIAGASEVKFFPDYYPFTEPSVQLSAKHPDLGWVEFAGAGMFRPEMLDNLGIKGEAIAWGVGIDRLAMFKMGSKDIRDLFSESLGFYRNAKGILL